MLVFILVGQAVLGLSDGGRIDPSRIHGGVDAPSGFAPHMVALLSGLAHPRVVCGGSIVSRRDVLTAAHCITPFVEGDRLAPSFHGRVGSNLWNSGGTLVQFRDHHIHPDWDLETIKNDVGVLKLAEDLVFSDTVAVIGIDFGWVRGGEPCYVTGWGTTWPKFDNISVNLAPTPDEKQLLYVSTLSPAACERLLHSDPRWQALAPDLDPKLEMCTFHSVGHGMCHGDSGSALVHYLTGKQAGVVSWGMPCAQGAPDVFTRLSGVRPFLDHVLNL